MNKNINKRRLIEDGKKVVVKKTKNIHSYSKYCKNLNIKYEEESQEMISILSGYKKDSTKNELNEIKEGLPIKNGDRKYYWIRKLINELLPIMSEDQRAYLYALEIVSARLIYNENEFINDLRDIMERNSWYVMNDKISINGPRRGGKTTIVAAFILLVGIVCDDIKCLIFSKTKQMSQNVGNAIVSMFEKITDKDMVAGLSIIRKNDNTFSFSRYKGHEASYTFRPGKSDIRHFLKTFIFTHT